MLQWGFSRALEFPFSHVLHKAICRLVKLRVYLNIPQPTKHSPRVAPQLDPAQAPELEFDTTLAHQALQGQAQNLSHSGVWKLFSMMAVAMSHG